VLEDKLTEANPERLLRLLVEQMTEQTLVLINPSGTIHWWGEGAQGQRGGHLKGKGQLVFGLEKHSAIGRPFSLLFTPEDQIAGSPEYEMTVARTHHTAEDDRWMGRLDGSRFWATGVLTAVRDQGGHLLGFGKVLRNSTDIREQLDTLRNQAQALTDANYQKDAFLSTLSHELRNPLAPLSNAVQLIRLTSSNRPELEQPLKTIERQIDQLRRLVDDLLDVSRAGAGKIDLKNEMMSVQDVIERAVESTRSVIRERRHTLDVLFPAARIMVEGERSRLERFS
jgi:PAS domain S-box-containing protein